MTAVHIPRVMTLGEPLVEVMRTELDRPLDRPGDLVGPFPSGAPAIFACAVARLGVTSGLIGLVGADEFGDCVLNRLRSDGVDTTLLRVIEGHPTGVAFVSYHSDGTRRFVFTAHRSAAAKLSPNDVPPAYVRGAEVVHVTGSTLAISESARDACYRAVLECKAAGGRITFDPNLRPELLGQASLEGVVAPILRVCSVLLPSAAEACLLSGEADEERAGRALVERGIPVVALKRGNLGSTVFTTQRIVDVPSIDVREVDPTGAGDCYDAAFVVGLLEGWDLARTARFANVAAALSVTRRGPMEGLPSREQVLGRV
jgi:tagatose kinase